MESLLPKLALTRRTRSVPLCGPPDWPSTGSRKISPASLAALSRGPVARRSEGRKWLEYAAVPSRVAVLGGWGLCSGMPQEPARTARERPGECSRRTAVRQCPPQLDRYHETRTKQTLARPKQREQPAP